MNYSLTEDDCMLNVSCSAMINETCSINFTPDTSNIMRNKMMENSVMLDLSQVEMYLFEFNATYEDLKISTRTSYSNSKLSNKMFTPTIYV